MGLGEGGAWTNRLGRKSWAKALHIGCVWTIWPQGLLGTAALIYSQAWGVLLSVQAPGWAAPHSRLFPGQGMNPSYDEYADSDEDQHDAYLERMKEEGKIREENANDSSDDSGEETGEFAWAVPGTGAVGSPWGQGWAHPGAGAGPLDFPGGPS